MNTRELEALDWDEQELSDLVVRYVQLFHRLPSVEQLVLFRRARRTVRRRTPKGGNRRPRLRVR